MNQWKTINLGEAASFLNGYAFKPSDWSDEGKEIIRIQNLTGSSSEVNYFTGQIDPRYKVVKGDLLISWSATLGIYEWGGEESWLNQHIFKVVFDKEIVDKSFFKHLIAHSLRKMEEQVHGATMKHITKKKFDSIQIPLPPLPVQQKIAAILDAADLHRRKTKTLIEKYDQLTQSIFLEMFGDPVKNEKGWKVSELSELMEITSSRRIFQNEYTDDGVPFYRTKEIVELSQGKKVSSELFISHERYNSIVSNNEIPSPGDILLSAVGTIGVMWIVNTQSPFYFKDGNLIWLKSSKAHELVPDYLKITLSYLIKHEIGKLAQGGAYNALTIIKLKKFPVNIAPFSLQIEFSERLKSISAQKAQIQISAEKSDELFNTLLQRAFKGELVS
jgi:type I restriction enzyme, S subunit